MISLAIMASIVVKAIIFLVVLVLLFVILVVPSQQNVVQKDKEAKERLDEYILSVEELYGTDRSQWLECILKR
jgi:hypothetical protein